MAGIGGIGMSALGQLLKGRGAVVSGSDRNESPVTTLLETKDIRVTIGQRAENVPSDATVLVYSAALPEAHPERAAARSLGIPELSYFEMLGEVAEGMRTIAVAGTHGKTTTTAMLGKLLIDTGASPNIVVGSLVKDFTGNYVEGTSNILVVEACEYQRHFLNLSPEVLIVTNIEYDHTDYFQDLADVQDAFRALMEKTTGTLVTDTNNPNIAPLLGGLSASVTTYMNEPHYEIRLLGEFNANNARAAVAAARVLLPELSEENIKMSLSTFSGTWRRFEYKGTTRKGAEVYDDYAHHPTAVHATLTALRKRVSGKVFAVFHPHLFSRTRDLFEDFAQSFKNADAVFIAPIYAAREEDNGSVSSEMLAARIREQGVNAVSGTFEEIEARVGEAAATGDTVITMGAGDIYKVADALVSK